MKWTDILSVSKNGYDINQLEVDGYSRLSDTDDVSACIIFREPTGSKFLMASFQIDVGLISTVKSTDKVRLRFQETGPSLHLVSGDGKTVLSYQALYAPEWTQRNIETIQRAAKTIRLGKKMLGDALSSRSLAR